MPSTPFVSLVSATLGVFLGSGAPMANVVPSPMAAVATASSTATGQIQVIDGQVRLSGDFASGAVEVGRGQVLAVELQDSEDDFAYAVTLSDDGSTPSPWYRSVSGTSSRATFSEVIDEIQIVVIAMEKETKKIVYGPIVVVKPKG